MPRVAHTREEPGFEGESEPPLLPAPPQKSGRDQLRIGDPPARQGLLFKPADTTGDIAWFLFLFQGYQGLRRPKSVYGVVRKTKGRGFESGFASPLFSPLFFVFLVRNCWAPAFTMYSHVL